MTNTKALAATATSDKAALAAAVANNGKPAKIAPALARGAEGKTSVHSRRSLDAQKGKTAPAKPKADPTPKKAPKAKPAKAKAEAKGIINRAGRVVLKSNAEVRAALKAAAIKAGGTRLEPMAFDSFSAFLNGFDAPAKGDQFIVFKALGSGIKIDEAKEVTLKIAATGAWSVA